MLEADNYLPIDRIKERRRIRGQDFGMRIFQIMTIELQVMAVCRNRQGGRPAFGNKIREEFPDCRFHAPPLSPPRYSTQSRMPRAEPEGLFHERKPKPQTRVRTASKAQITLTRTPKASRMPSAKPAKPSLSQIRNKRMLDLSKRMVSNRSAPVRHRNPLSSRLSASKSLAGTCKGDVKSPAKQGILKRLYKKPMRTARREISRHANRFRQRQIHPASGAAHQGTNQ